jgi:hypothetical protein
MKVLSTYSTDPFLLDIGKDLLIDFSKASNLCLLTVNQHCIPQLSVWLMHCSNGVGGGDGNGSNTEGSSDSLYTGSSSGSGSGVFYVPPSLVDKSIDIVCAMCLSPTLSSFSTAQEPAEIVLSCLNILLSSLSVSGHPCRREGMQAINLIFSHYQGQILNFFTTDRPTPSRPNMTVESFSLALAELILQTLKGLEADSGVSGDCSGAVAGLLCHLLNNFKNSLDIFIVNSLLSATLQCLRSTSSCYVKSSLLMGLIHLFARDTALMANSTSPLLGTLPSRDPGGKAESALGYVLEEWCSLHVHLESKYSGTISTLGFLELIKMFNMHASNHGFALKVLQLTLKTLPRILLNTDGKIDKMHYGHMLRGLDNAHCVLFVHQLIYFSILQMRGMRRAMATMIEIETITAMTLTTMSGRAKMKIMKTIWTRKISKAWTA